MLVRKCCNHQSFLDNAYIIKFGLIIAQFIGKKLPVSMTSCSGSNGWEDCLLLAQIQYSSRPTHSRMYSRKRLVAGEAFWWE